MLEKEKLAVLSLWAIPGIGPQSLVRLGNYCEGAFKTLLGLPLQDWLPAAPLNDSVKARFQRYSSLDQLGNSLLESTERLQMEIAFKGDAGYPEVLSKISDAPPLIFFRGVIGASRPRLAMVGSRHPEQGFIPFARSFSKRISESGAGIISGAAQGVDSACHRGALDARSETWAFLGSSLDMLDRFHQNLEHDCLSYGGMFFSELPPGTAATRYTFPRRNRLISGASDAVLVLRAAEKSGTLHTAEAALKQKKPLFALPGDPRNQSAKGCNDLIARGSASACSGVEQMVEALGLKLTETPSLPIAGEDLSVSARAAYCALPSTPQPFEKVKSATQMDTDGLISALCELEVYGLVVQHPGKYYEKI